MSSSLAWARSDHRAPRVTLPRYAPRYKYTDQPQPVVIDYTPEPRPGEETTASRWLSLPLRVQQCICDATSSHPGVSVGALLSPWRNASVCGARREVTTHLLAMGFHHSQIARWLGLSTGSIRGPKGQQRRAEYLRETGRAERLSREESA